MTCKAITVQWTDTPGLYNATFEEVFETVLFPITINTIITLYNESETQSTYCSISPNEGEADLINIPAGSSHIIVQDIDPLLYPSLLMIDFTSTTGVYIAVVDYAPLGDCTIELKSRYDWEIPGGAFEVLAPTVEYDPVAALPVTIENEIGTLDPQVATDAGIASITSGLWSDTATWAGGDVPIDGNAVAISENHTVVFDVDQSSFAVGLDGLVIHGVLEFATQSPVTATALIPASLTPCLTMKEGKQISGEGSLYVGNSVTDQIAMPPVGSSYRALIRWIGTPPTKLIDLTYASFNGWYDLLNETTLAEAPLTGATTIILTDNLILQAGDVIAIGAAVNQGGFIESAEGRYAVASYDLSTKTVTLTEALTDERLAGDPVSHVSRPVKIEATTTDEVAVFKTRIGAFDSFEGVWVAGGPYIITGLTEIHAATACTIEGNYYPAFYSCPGELDLDLITILNPMTDPLSGALVDQMTGRVFLNDCTVLNGEVGISRTSGLKADNCTIQNMTTTCLSDMRSSIFRGNRLKGSVLGVSAGGHNRYISVTLANNVVDATGEYEAEAYGLILGNPDSLGLPIDVEAKQWYKNRSYDHNGLQSDHRVYCVGGVGVTQSIVTFGDLPTWKFSVTVEKKPIYWDVAFLAVAGQQVQVSANMQKNFLGGSVAFQIVKPDQDPLFGFGDAALAEVQLPDEISHWETLSLTHYPNATETLYARIFIQNTIAEGDVYVYIGALDALTVTGAEVPLAY